jgi:hypothetical protein
VAGIPEREDGKLDDERFLHVLASEWMVVSSRKLARSMLLIAITMDWK